MTIKKIVFIEPKTESLNIFTRFELPRLGSILLATIMRDRGYDTSVFVEKKSVILSGKIDADLVAVSTITPTTPSAYEIGDHFRRRGIKVVMGGPHVTFLPEEALAHADYVVRGEGEHALPALVAALESNGPFGAVPGLSWKEDDKIRMNEPAEPVRDLDSLPSPDFTLVHRHGKRKKKWLVPIQTSRGCPFDCTFCSVTGMFGKRYRFRSVNNIITELKRYNPKKNFIFFYDDNFTANKRRTRELLTAMIEENLGFSWSTQVRVDVAKDPELLDLMRRAGCVTLYIGFESVDPAALLEMKKSQTVADMRNGIREIRARGIHVHGMFVFGFEADTERTVHSTVTFAIKEKIDTAQFLILTPLPGTRFFKDMLGQKRIFDSNWTHYDAHHVAFTPKHFTTYALQRAQLRGHARFYAPQRVIQRLFRGRLAAFVIGLYAGNLNRKWKRIEKSYLYFLKHNLFPARLPAAHPEPVKS